MQREGAERGSAKGCAPRIGRASAPLYDVDMNRSRRPTRIMACFCVWMCAAFVLGADAPGSYGEPIRLTTATPLADVLSSPDAYVERTILLKGRVADVCQKKGCWTLLQDGDATVRVRFLDYGFFVPKDIQGREMLVEGKISVRTLSEKDAKHYARESIAGDAASIEGPQREVGFVASGVRLVARP